MSELEKAKQEVEQVCFAYDKAGDTGDIKDWKGFYDLENKLIDKVKISNQPQLTIPKSIADELEEYDAGKKGNYSLFSLSKRAKEFYLSHHDLVTIYFSSKALGVDLVKVVEG